MKKLIPLIMIILIISFPCSAQKKQPKGSAIDKDFLNPEHWTFREGRVEFTEYKGRRVMKISPQSGPVVLKNFVFKNGTIEYDIEPILPEFADAIYFHRKDENEQEIVYLRVNKMENKFANEGIQYCPYFDGVNMWDMYPQYQAPAFAKTGEFNHVKLIISGYQMRVFVNRKPVLEIPKLEGRETEGSIAFEGAAYVSNLKIKAGVTEGLSSEEGFDLTQHEANYIRNWSATQPAFLITGTEPTSAMDFPKSDSFTEKFEAERGGFINLTRSFGASEKRRIVWLRSTISTKEAMKTNLQLGLSDEVWLYLNNQLTYVDKNLFIQNMKKYPDGRISIQNASVRLNLKQGENDLLIGVANDFYGWGIIARLENIEGIVEARGFNPPQKIAIDNIEQYLGVYSSKDIPIKFTITQNKDQLIAQAGNQEAAPLTYDGNNVFKVERFALDLAFKPEEKKLILKQNGTNTEFMKE